MSRPSQSENEALHSFGPIPGTLISTEKLNEVKGYMLDAATDYAPSVTKVRSAACNRRTVRKLNGSDGATRSSTMNRP